MNLQRKLLLVVGLAVVLLSAGLYLTLRFAVLAGFERLERRTAHRTLGRVLRVLEDEIKDLELISAHWERRLGANPAPFPSTPLPDSAFENLRLNFAAVIDAEGQVLSLQSPGSATGASGLSATDVSNAIPPILALQAATTSGTPVVFWAGTPLPTLIAARPEPIRADAGAAPGLLLLGRRLDAQTLTDLGERSYVTIELLTRPQLAGPEKTLWTRLAPRQSPSPLIVSDSDHKLIGYHLLRDLNQQPLALIKVRFPGEIFDMARTSVNLMIWLVVGVAILLGMITLALVRQLILVNLIQSLSSLNTGIDRIAKDGNPARRVKQAGQDEMRELAEGINRMLETLEQAQIHLRESENRYRSLVESAPDAIFTLNEQGQLLSLNSTTARLLNPDPAPTRLLTLKDLFPLDATPILEPELARIWSGGDPASSLEVRRPLAGGTRWFSVSLTPVRHEGLLRYVLGMARDITDRVLAEQRAQEQRQQLIQAHKLMALGTLVSGVAHEINNPNNVIMLNTPLIRRTLDRWVAAFHTRTGTLPEGGPSAEQIESLPAMLRGIEDSSRRIHKIVESLKDFARPHPNRLNETVDLKSVIETAIQLLDHPLRQATHHFQWQCPDGLPPLLGNKQRLEQVFINLLQNACQALPDPEHGITLTVEPPASGGTTLRIRIQDEGVGIPPDHLPLLSTPFFTTNRARGGTGLGLSISLGILKEHGGDLAFESQPGSGTTVTVTLPIASESGIESAKRPVHNGPPQTP